MLRHEMVLQNGPESRAVVWERTAAEYARREVVIDAAAVIEFVRSDSGKGKLTSRAAKSHGKLLACWCWEIPITQGCIELETGNLIGLPNGRRQRSATARGHQMQA
jgi:hypothetical protein